MTETTSPPTIAHRATLWGLALSVLVASLGTSAANVALPTFAEDLGGTFRQTQWVALAYLLAMTATSVTVGYLGDLIGRRRMLLIGAGLFTAAALACALSPDLGTLVAARAVQGIGAAVMMALPLSIVRDTVAEGRVGSAMGLLGTTAAVGTASGPALGGLLLGAAGWPAIFWAMVPLGLVAVVLIRAGAPVPARASATPRTFDFAGILLLTLAVALYTLSVTDPGESGGRASWPLAAGAVVAVAAFLLVERRAAHPVLPLSLLATRAIGVGAVLNLLVGTVMMSTLVVGPFFLAGALHLSPAAIGATMAAGPIASICTGIVAGRIVDRFGGRGMTTVGLSAMTVGALALALLPGWWGLPGYITGTVLLAPGYQLFLAANNTQVIGATAPERRGTVSGVLGLSRNLGLVTGASVLATLFATASGAAADPAALTGALRITFLVTAALLVAAVLISPLASTRVRTSAPDSPRPARS